MSQLAKQIAVAALVWDDTRLSVQRLRDERDATMCDRERGYEAALVEWTESGEGFAPELPVPCWKLVKSDCEAPQCLSCQRRYALHLEAKATAQLSGGRLRGFRKLLKRAWLDVARSEAA